MCARKIALLILFTTTSLDARTKNSRLQIRISREKPMRDVEEWECIPRSMLPQRVLNRMGQVQGVASAHDQIKILHALMDEEQDRICTHGNNAIENSDEGGHEVFSGTGVALAFMGVLLERASFLKGGSGPLSMQVASWLNSLPDEAVAAAASFFMKWLLVLHDPLRSCAGIGALCSLRGKQEVMRSVCVQTAVFKKCLEALSQAVCPSQCRTALQALKALLDLSANMACEGCDDARPHHLPLRLALPLESLAEGKECLISLTTKMWYQQSHECQVAAAHSLALILLSSHRQAAGRQWEDELSCALQRVPPTARCALLRRILLKTPFGELSDAERGLLWGAGMAILKPPPPAKSDTPTMEQRIGSLPRHRAEDWLSRLDPAWQLVPGTLAEGIESAALFLAHETLFLRRQAEGEGNFRGNLLQPLARVKEVMLCIFPPISIWRPGEADEKRLLKLYRAALAQRDQCWSMGRDGAEWGGQYNQLRFSTAFRGLCDSDLLDAVMSMDPSLRVRYLLARPLVGSLFCLAPEASENAAVRPSSKSGECVNTSRGTLAESHSSAGRAAAAAWHEGRGALATRMLRATLRALTTSRALAKAASPLLAELIAMEARGAEGWWVVTVADALLDEEQREFVANFGLDVICRSRHGAGDVLLRHLLARLERAEATQAGRGGGVLECLQGSACAPERVLWAALKLLEAILREGDRQRDDPLEQEKSEDAPVPHGALWKPAGMSPSACVTKALAGSNPGLRLLAFKLTLQCDALLREALDASLLSRSGVLARLALATDLKGMARGVAIDFKEQVRALLIASRIHMRRSLKYNSTDAGERELRLLQKIGYLVGAVLSPSMGTAVSRKEGALCLMSNALDVWVPRAALRIDSRIHSPACFRARSTPNQSVGKDAFGAGEPALWRSVCLCPQDMGRESGGASAVVAALGSVDICRGLWNALMHNFESVRSGAANVLVRLARVLPGVGLSSREHMLEIIHVAEDLMVKSTKRQLAESGALLMQVAVVCLGPSIVSCPIFHSDTEGVTETKMLAAEHQDTNSSNAAFLLFSRTLKKMCNVTIHSRQRGRAAAAPPAFAYGLFLVLRKLLPFAWTQDLPRGTCVVDKDSTASDATSNLGAVWQKAIRSALTESLKTIDVARRDLNDMYICSGGMDDDEEDDAREEGAAAAEEEAAREINSSERQAQRGCWLTLKEGVLFLAELARFALSAEPQTQQRASPAKTPLLLFADLQEIGRALLEVVFCSQHNGLVEQTCGALHTLATALLTCSKSRNHSLSPRLYHRALGQGLEASPCTGPGEDSDMPVGTPLALPRMASELPRFWLLQLLAKLSDNAVSIGRRSSQLSMAIQALLGADSGTDLYNEALPRLLTAAGAGAGGPSQSEGLTGESTRVRAIMSLRFLLRDARCGEKVIRLKGDQLLCSILSALQCQNWPVRNAANLALGAAVERIMGRQPTQALQARAFCRNFPEFARALADYFSLSAAALHSAVAPRTDNALMAVLALLCRLSPGLDELSAPLCPETDATVIDMWRACQELGDCHPQRDIREASLQACMFILPGGSSSAAGLASDLRSILSGPGADRNSLRLESVCYRLLLFLSKEAGGDGLADTGAADHGRGDLAANRAGGSLRGVRGPHIHAQRCDDDSIGGLCADVASAVAKVFATSWGDMLTERGGGPFSAAAQKELLRVLERLYCHEPLPISARAPLKEAAGRVRTWLCHSQQRLSSDLTRVRGLPPLLHVAAGLCVRSAGLLGDPSRHTQESPPSQWKVRREVCQELLARRETEIRLGCLQVISECLQHGGEPSREGASDVFLHLAQEEDSECVREVLSCLIARPPCLHSLIEPDTEYERSWLKLCALCRAPEPSARSMALAAIGGIFGTASCVVNRSCLAPNAGTLYPGNISLFAADMELQQTNVPRSLDQWMDSLEEDSDPVRGVNSRRAAAVALRASRLLSCRWPQASACSVLASDADDLVVRGWIAAMRLVQDDDTLVSSSASGAIASAVLCGGREERRDQEAGAPPQSMMYAPIALRKAACQLVRVLVAGKCVDRVWDYIKMLLNSWQSSVEARRPVQYSHILHRFGSDDDDQPLSEGAGGALQQGQVCYENESGLALAAIASQLQKDGITAELLTSSTDHDETKRRFYEWRAHPISQRWAMLLDAVVGGAE